MVELLLHLSRSEFCERKRSKGVGKSKMSVRQKGWKERGGKCEEAREGREEKKGWRRGGNKEQYSNGICSIEAIELHVLHLSTELITAVH